MRFFSKFVFICNLCFIATVILRFTEAAKRSKGNLEPAIALQPLQSSLVVLGYSAIIFNVIFFAVNIVSKLGRKINPVPAWLIWFNLLLFPVQIWYFFFSNF